MLALFVVPAYATSASEDEPYNISWTDTTNTYTPAKDQTRATKEITSYSFDYVNDYSWGTPTEQHTYEFDYLYVWVEYNIWDTIKYNHDPLATSRQILNIQNKLTLSLSSSINGSYPLSIVQFDLVDSEVQSTANTVYCTRINGNSSTLINSSTFILGESTGARYQTERYTIHNRYRILVRADCSSLASSATQNTDALTAAISNIVTADIVSGSQEVTISSYQSYETVIDTVENQLEHIDRKLYELNECSDDIYHELYQLHTRIISMHTTLSELLTVLSSFASQTNSQLTAILTLLTQEDNSIWTLYALLQRSLENYNPSQASEYAGVIATKESLEDVAVSAIESAAPVVDSQVAVLESMPVLNFFESNQKAATFWKTLLNNFFDTEVLGIIGAFMSLIVVILLIKFVLRV